MWILGLKGLKTFFLASSQVAQTEDAVQRE